jgi:hypothetical protein
MLCQSLCYDEGRFVGWVSGIQDFLASLGHQVNAEFINESVLTRTSSLAAICDGDVAPHSQRWTTTL